MNRYPLVSVIIPTYNRAEILSAAIESVLAQTYPNIELLVVDDGSEDGTAELMDRYPQARYIVQQHAGQAAARNNGLAHAKGEIIASLDSDDLWYPDFLTCCVSKLERDRLDFVFANWDQETAGGNTRDFLAADPYLIPFFHKLEKGWVRLEQRELREIYISACPSPSSSVVLRRDSIFCGWDEKMNIGDDWMIYLEMILSGSASMCAAFTLEKLWKKRLDDKNIYDGRRWSEVLQFLYIDDTAYIANRFDGLLSAEEKKLLAQRQAGAMVELAKYKGGRERDFPKAMELLKTSFTIDGLFTLRKIGSVLYHSLGRLGRASHAKSNGNEVQLRID